MLKRLGLLLIGLWVATPVWADVTKVDSAKLQQLIADGVPVIDIRRADEWRQTGVIDGAHLMTFFDAQGQYDFPNWLARLANLVSKNEPVVLICQSGVRSNAISRVLHSKLGYTKVFDATAGMAGWLREKRPTVPPSE